MVSATRWSRNPGSFDRNLHPLVLVAAVFWDRWSPYQSGRLDRFHCTCTVAVSSPLQGLLEGMQSVIFASKHLAVGDDVCCQAKIPDATAKGSRLHGLAGEVNAPGWSARWPRTSSSMLALRWIRSPFSTPIGCGFDPSQSGISHFTAVTPS